MINERDIERTLNEWLAAGPSESPDRVLGVVADRISRQGQRGAWRFPRWELPMTRDRRVAAGAVVLVLFLIGGIGLSALPPRAGVAVPSASASTSPTASPSPKATFPPASAIPTPLGRLEPGRYSSRVFPHRLTYSVPDGWWNEADDPTAFVLSRGPENANNIELVFDAYPPILDERSCQAQPDWDRPHRMSDLLAYWRSHPGLKIDTQDETSVGGLPGWKVILSLRPGWKSPCRGPDGEPAYVVHWSDGVPFTLGFSGTIQLTILEDADGRTIVLETRGEDPRILGEESAIVDSFVFDLPAASPTP